MTSGRFRRRLWLALLTSGLLLSGASATADSTPPAIPEAARKKLVGLPLDCQKAYAKMQACMEKTLAAGAPASLRPQWERQLDDALTSWQALRGQPAVLELCREIAADPECAD
jgi:hypothetical protein